MCLFLRVSFLCGFTGKLEEGSASEVVPLLVNVFFIATLLANGMPGPELET